MTIPTLAEVRAEVAYQFEHDTPEVLVNFLAEVASAAEEELSHWAVQSLNRNPSC